MYPARKERCGSNADTAEIPFHVWHPRTVLRDKITAQSTRR